MKIKTTINMRKDLAEKITDAATSTRITVPAIISALLQNYAEKAARQEASWGRVRYQPRCHETEWKKLHYQPEQDEYEYSIDLRKVMKMSVSFLVAYAIEHFLDELLAIWGRKIDNYRFRNYIMSQFYVNNVAYWIYYWGIPPALLSPTD